MNPKISQKEELKENWEQEFDEKFISILSDKRNHFVNPDMDGSQLKSWIKQNFISKQELIEELEGIKRKPKKHDENRYYTIDELHDFESDSYNQAIQDIIKKLKI